MDWLYLRNTVTFQMLFLVFILHVSINAQGQVQPCPVFKVSRGIVHKVCLNKSLKISCSLKNCGQKINITWTKADDLDKWIPVNKTNQISSSQTDFDSHNLTSYLSFPNVLNHHEGLYRCELKLSNMSTVSHYINVSISDGSNGTEISCTEILNVPDSESVILWWLPYLLICMGVVFLVLMTTIISILCITGFNCLRKKVHQISQVQNSEETLRHNIGLSTLPPDQSTPYESNDAHDSLSNTENNQLSQVIYASLHHFIPTQSSTTSFRTGEEFTEYAPIRVS